MSDSKAKAKLRVIKNVVRSKSKEPSAKSLINTDKEKKQMSKMRTLL